MSRFIEWISRLLKPDFEYEIKPNVFEGHGCGLRSIVCDPPNDGELILYDGEDCDRGVLGVYRYYIEPWGIVLHQVTHTGRLYRDRGKIINPHGSWKPVD